MSKFFKKITSIETEDDDVSSEGKLASKSDYAKDTVKKDVETQSVNLRKSSSADDMNEVFESSEDMPLSGDEGLADLPFPGFLSRGIDAKDPFTGKAPTAKAAHEIPPESKKLLFKMPVPAKTAPQASEPQKNLESDIRLPKYEPSPDSLSQRNMSSPSDLDILPLSSYVSPERHEASGKDAIGKFSFFKTGTILAVFFWIIISSAVAYGYFDLGLTWKTLTPINLAGLTLLVLAPAFLIALSAYTFSQLAHLSRAAGQLNTTTQALMRPDETVIDKTMQMSQVIKNQIDTVDARLAQAQARMADMEGVIGVQSDALKGLRISIETSAHHITHTFQMERSEFESASAELDEKMNALIRMVSEHSATLSQLSKLAEQKITEARINTEGAAAKMNSASELVRQNTVEATASLKSGHQEIEQLGDMILKSSHGLDSIYKNHAKDLTLMIEQLRDEQENLGVSLEARLAKMRAVADSAKLSAESLTVAGESGRNTVVALSEASRITEDALRTRFAEMEKMVEYSNSRAENINQMAARRVQNSLALTRKEIARIETDMQTLQDRLNTQIEASLIPVLPPSQVPPAITAPIDNTLSDTVSAADENPVEIASNSRRNPLRLQPLDEIEDQAFDTSDAEDNSLGNLNSKNDPASSSVSDIAARKLNLRIVDEDEDEGEDTELQADFPSSFQNDLEYEDYDDSLEIPETAPEPLKDDLVQKVESVETPSRKEEDLELDNRFFEKLAPSTLTTPTEPSRVPDDDKLVAPISSPAPRRTKPKWSWKSVLSGQFAEETAHLDKKPQPTQVSQSNESQIIATLTGMGLSPGAIVDEGCIVEAADKRVLNGSSAMSHCVSQRLQDPVKHLRGALDMNPEFKSDARAFTSQFQTRLDTSHNDRDSIRTRLESETGRAFLLCDAALNG